MPKSSDALFSGRECRRLQTARENGYLNTTCPDNARLVKAYGLWCWRLKIPMVWCERRSPRSRYGQVHLEMLTTANMLTSAGQSALKTLGTARVSPHDAVWDDIPFRKLASLCHAAYRAAVKTQHYKLNRVPVKIDMRSRSLRLIPKKAAFA